METLKCDVCAKSFTGIVCFQQHVASEKHKKNVRLINGVTFETPKAINLDVVNQLYCSVCKLSISGLDNYQKHVNGLDHAIMVQKTNGDLLSQSVSPTFELKTEQNKVVESSIPFASSVAIMKPYAECKSCQKQFSGIEPYQQHLASAKHIKQCKFSSQIMQNNETVANIANQKSNDVLPNDYQSSVSVSNCNKMLPASSFESFNTLKCDLCAMTFSGPVPYQQHLVSNGHSKKVNNTELSKKLTAESSTPSDSTLKPNIVNLESFSLNEPGKWYCEPCKKQCSGPVPYNSHLIGREHAKRIKVLEIEENMRKFKESNSLLCIGNDETDSNLSNKVTSTTDLKTDIVKEMQDSIKINDLNINVKNNESKILPDKFKMHADDLIALPNLNIIPPEQLDVTVFGTEDEIVFSSSMKVRQ